MTYTFVHSRHCWSWVQRNYLRSKSGDISPTDPFLAVNFWRIIYASCQQNIQRHEDEREENRNFRRIFLSCNLRGGREVRRKNPEESRGVERQEEKDGRKDGKERGRGRVMKSEKTRNRDEIAEWKRVSGGVLETTAEERCLRHVWTATAAATNSSDLLNSANSCGIASCARRTRYVRECTVVRNFCFRRRVGLIKCSPSDVGYRHETYCAWVLSSRKRWIRDGHSRGDIWERIQLYEYADGPRGHLLQS